MRKRFPSFVSLIVIFSLLFGFGEPVARGRAQAYSPIATTQTHSAPASVQPAAPLLTRVFLPYISAGRAASVVLVAGDQQSATVGTAVAIAPSVRVLAMDGQSVPGVRVDFVVSGGGGQVSGREQVTDTSGIATAGRWTLGTTMGPNTLDVMYAGQHVLSIHATGTVGAAATLVKVSGDGGISPVGDTRLLEARVVDTHGNPVANHTVSWIVASGDGSLNTSSSATAADGRATTTWTVGATPGSQSVTATAPDLLNSPLTFTVSVMADGASLLTSTIHAAPTSLTADGQSRATITVQLKNASGSNLTTSAGRVTLSATAGTLSAVTDHGDGTYTATYTAPTIVGTTIISGTLGGNALSDTATIDVQAGPAAEITKVAGDGGTAPVGSERRLQIQVTDAHGNPVQGYTVAWAVAAGGGNVGAPSSITDADGIALVDWTLSTTAGTQSATATADGLTGSPGTFTVTVTAASAARLVITTQPSATAQSGTPITQQPVVQLRDAYGNLVQQAGVAVTATIATGAGTLAGTLTVATDTNGQAAFTDLSITGSIGDRTIAFSATSLTAATSTPIAVTAGAATQLVITTQPASTAQSGITFSQQPAVHLQDVSGNTVAQEGIAVTVAIASGGGTLSGNATVPTNALGAARFTDLAISGTVGNRTLSFSAAGLTGTTSSTISLTSGTATQLVITTQPSSAAQAGMIFGQQPVIQLQDVSGNAVAQAGRTITASIATGGGTLDGTLTATTNSSGVASFTNLSIGGVTGNRTLAFTADGVTGATSTVVTITAGSAAALVFSAQPTQVIANAPITPAVQVSITDAYGNLVTTATDSITIAIGANPSSSTLAGTMTIVASAGIAVFSDLSLTKAGTGYTLRATTGTLSSATSAAFNVVVGPLDHFLVEQANGGLIGNQRAGTPFAVQITAQDAYNNTVTTFTGTVNFTSTPSGGISAGSTSAAFTDGVLSSQSITFGTSGTFTLTATSGVQSGTSNAFQVQTPPVATNDGPAANSSPGHAYHAVYSTANSPQTFTLPAPGVLANDNLGFPTATITSFGGDSAGGTVTSNTAGTTVSPLPAGSGSLHVAGNGAVTFTPPNGFTGNFVFQYRLTNAQGPSDAQITIAVGARPVANNDSYTPTLIGNVPINTATSSQFRITDNDSGDAKMLSIVGQNNGTAAINPDNTFSFRPTLGYQGPASFSYTVQNGFGVSAAATVSMMVATPIWFVNGAAGAGGDGRFDAPFNTLASLAAINNGTGTNPAAGARIFLYTGTGTYTGPLTLLAEQRLIGQGATVSLSSIAGVTWAADAGSEPAMSGTAPVITAAAGATAVTLANIGSATTANNTLRGINLGNVGATGTALAGTSFGTMTISEVGIATNGRALNLSTGTLDGSFTAVTSTGGANNIVLANVSTSGTSVLGSSADTLSGATGDAIVITGGNGSFTYAGSVINTSTLAVNISGKTGGSVTISGAINPAAAGRGIVIANNAMGVNMFALSGASKKISSGASAGVSLTNNSGASIIFTGGLEIATTTGNGFQASGGGTVQVSGTTNMISSAGGTALSVANTTIGVGGLNFRSISANGGTNGIVLNNTGSTSGLTVTGSGSTNSGGTIQNTTGAGILLTSTLSPSFMHMNVQSTGRSGINGSLVTNFSFINGTINNSGTSGTDDQDSNIDFYQTTTTTENNVSGVVTIVGNVLTNARGNGIDIGNGNGTISDLNVSSNTLTSSADVTFSKGSGMRVVIDGSASTVAHLTKATIANNVITNFPGGGGINVDCGNGDPSGMAGTCGIVGNSTNKVSITGNRIAGDATTKMGTKAIAAPVAGKGQGNFDISNNGTVAEPLRNTVGHVIDVNAMGQAQVAATISGNRINANNVLSSRGIAIGADIATNFTTTAVLNATISDNVVSNTNGVGISATAVRSGTTVRASITNNSVSAPTSGNYGIGVFTNPDNTVTPTVCVDIKGNTTVGGTASGTTWPGIGLTKRTASIFGIVGLSPSPTGTPTVENYVNSLNSSASGTFGTGGTALGSATSGFTSCTL